MNIQVNDTPTETPSIVPDLHAHDGANDLASLGELAPGANEKRVGEEKSETKKEPTPEERADKTAGFYHAGVDRLIDCGVEFMEARRALKGDNKGMERYGARLHERGMLTQREAADPSGSAKLSRLNKIGEQSDYLRIPDVRQIVGPRYTLLYACAAICEKLAEAGEDPSQKLVNILKECPNEEVDRAYLTGVLKDLKTESRRGTDEGKEPTVNPEGVNGEVSTSDLSPSEQPNEEAKVRSKANDAEPKWPALIKGNNRFDRILITPRAADKKLLSQALADPSQPGKQLPVEQVAARDAAVVIECEIRDLPSIGQFLPGWDFKKPPKYLAISRTNEPDIGGDRVLVVLERGNVAIDLAKFKPAAEEPMNIVKTVTAICPGGEWLHVFAEGPLPGVTSLIGDDGWLDGVAS